MLGGKVLLGITNNTAIMQLNGLSNFLGGFVKNPDVHDVVREIDRRMQIARKAGFCDVVILWPVQYLMETSKTTGGKKTCRIVERKPLPLAEIAGICGKHGVFFSLIYCEGHLHLDRPLARVMQRRSRGRFLGECLGEVGGRTWYSAEKIMQIEKTGEQGNPAIDCVKYRWRARDMLEAKNNYVDYIRRRVDKYKKMGCPVSLTADSTAMHKYNVEGGVDIPAVEISHDLGACAALARGAAKSRGKRLWAAYLPLAYYWGWPHSTSAKAKRWETALYLSFMAGANMIINEGGEFGTQLNTPDLTKKGILKSGGKWCANIRKIFTGFARFRDLHRRPAGQPEAAIGIIQGHLDGWNNIPQPGQKVWGQHQGGQWNTGPAEESWRYLKVFLPGGHWLTGTPFGQVDVISSDAPLRAMRKYKLLVFLGWHTMTEEFMSKLKEFASEGGTAFMTLAHLDTRADRGKCVRLINRTCQKDVLKFEITDGANAPGRINSINHVILPGMSGEYALDGSIDLAEAKLSGARPVARAGQKPALVRTGINRGEIYTLLARNYPGEKCLDKFVAGILRSLAAKTLEAQKITVSGSPAMNYAVFKPGGDRPQAIYILEYDPEIDEYDGTKSVTNILSGKRPVPSRACRVRINNQEFGLNLKTNELRCVYLADGLAISPSGRRVTLKKHMRTGRHHEFTLSGEGRTEVALAAAGGKISVTAENGKEIEFKRDLLNNCIKFKAVLTPGRDYVFSLHAGPPQ